MGKNSVLHSVIVPYKLKCFRFGMFPFKTKKSIEQIFSKADRNGDGKINREEFEFLVQTDVKDMQALGGI